MATTPGPRGDDRRRQVDRSAATTAALADATIDLLVERGWAAVTAVEVCHRVGVTRGAFHHHYESLAHLLADALGRLYDEMRTAPRPEVGDLVSMVDVAWTHVGTPRFQAVIEAWLAMANDPTLRPRIGPVVAEFAALVDPVRLVPSAGDADVRDFLLTAREAMLGLALGRATNDGRPLPHEARVLARLRAEAATLAAG
jgi:AcrR family transcriptional regulator